MIGFVLSSPRWHDGWLPSLKSLQEPRKSMFQGPHAKPILYWPRARSGEQCSQWLLLELQLLPSPPHNRRCQTYQVSSGNLVLKDSKAADSTESDVARLVFLETATRITGALRLKKDASSTIDRPACRAARQIASLLAILALPRLLCLTAASLICLTPSAYLEHRHRHMIHFARIVHEILRLASACVRLHKLSSTGG